MNPWISALIAVVGGFVIGTVASRIVRRVIGKSSNSSVAEAAGPIASLVMSIAIIFGMITGLGFVQPGALDTIPADLVTFIPRLVAAMIVLIGGNIVASLLRTAATRALKGMGAVERFGPGLLRGIVMAFAFILAAAQLGVDTTIINILAAAVLFGTAAAMAMLVGLGGRHVAGELAAGRAWRSSLQPGDRIRAVNVQGVDVDGTVIEIHPTAVEVDGGGRTFLVPNSQLMNVVVERVRRSDDD